MSGHNEDHKNVFSFRGRRVTGGAKPEASRDNEVLEAFGTGTVNVQPPPKTPGLVLSLTMSDGAGPVTFNFPAGINGAGNTNIQFTAQGQDAMLRSIRSGTTLLWKLVVNNGGTLS